MIKEQPPTMSRSPQIKMRDGHRRINEAKNVLGKISLVNGVTSWRSCSCVQRGCVNRPLRCDAHSGVLIGEGGERRSDWPAHVLANDVSTGIDR